VGPVAEALAALAAGDGGPTISVDGLGGTIEGEPFYALVPLGLVEVTGPVGEAAFAALGLHTARVRPAPGGVLPRAICQLVNEAHFSLGEGVAGAAEIDDGMVLGLNHPRGPLAWGAMLGLENVRKTLGELRELHGDAYRIAPALR
jgi:3-hydroxybutyryl-CoA dehydrogenase